MDAGGKRLPGTHRGRQIDEKNCWTQVRADRYVVCVVKQSLGGRTLFLPNDNGGESVGKPNRAGL